MNAPTEGFAQEDMYPRLTQRLPTKRTPKPAGTVSTDASDPEPRPLGRILGVHPAGGQALAPTARRAARRRESRTCTHARTHARTHIHSRAHTHMHTHAIKETGREATTGHACLFLGCDTPATCFKPHSSVQARWTRCRGHHRTVFFARTQAASRLRPNPAVEQRNDSGTRTSKYLTSLFSAQCI